MATSPKRMTVKTTPGKNAPVDHVLRLEDLLRQMQRGTVKTARRSRTAPATGTAELSAVQQLAAELEARMRELRAAPSGAATATPATRSGGPRKKVRSTER